MVNGNYMYVTTPMDHLIAMDATSGKVLWKYDYPARLPAPRLQSAVAWDAGAGRLVTVADKKEGTKRTHSKVPVLYTADQAAKGLIAYGQNCAMCHGPLLEGQIGGYPGPALKGADFADPSYNFHVSDIFNFVAKLMPPGTPGSLTHDQRTDHGVSPAAERLSAGQQRTVV